MSYEISIDKVIDMFKEIAGEESVIEGKIFCRTAVDLVGTWLKESDELERMGNQICYATACIANYRYTLKNSTNTVDIDAGDITVRDCSESSVKFAEQLMNDAISAIESVLKPKRFAFVSTEV